MIPCSGTLRILYCRHYGCCSQPRNLFQDGVRTSCRAVDGGMKSAKFMRRIIRICHAPLTTKAPEKFERLVASPRSSLVVTKTKPRKTSNMMHVTGMKVKKMHFWMRVVENPSADSVKGGNVSTEQKGLLVLFFFHGWAFFYTFVGVGGNAVLKKKLLAASVFDDFFVALSITRNGC